MYERKVGALAIGVVVGVYPTVNHIVKRWVDKAVPQNTFLEKGFARFGRAAITLTLTDLVSDHVLDSILKMNNVVKTAWKNKD